MIRFLDRLARPIVFKCMVGARAMGISIPNKFSRHLHYKGVVHVPLENNRSFKMKSYGHSIENRLYWYGKLGHEPETFIPWLRAASSANVVLDIGANTALYSLGAAGQNSNVKVFAFEPLPRVAALARTNVELNSGFDITICQNAVSDESGQATLHDPGGDQPASASLRSDFLGGEQDAVTVEAVRIDDFVRKQNLESVDLIKLDVEGIEELALRGMRETIERFKPTLFIEVLDGRPELMKELLFLVELGYEVGDLTEEGVVALKLDNSKGKERNLLFTMDLSKFQS